MFYPLFISFVINMRLNCAASVYATLVSVMLINWYPCLLVMVACIDLINVEVIFYPLLTVMLSFASDFFVTINSLVQRALHAIAPASAI